MKFALADDNLPIQFCEGEGSRPDKSNGPLSASPSLILPCIKPHFQPYGIIHFRLLLEKSFSRQVVLELGIAGIDLSKFVEYLEGEDFSGIVSYSYKVFPSGIAVMVCDRDGNVLLDKDNKWNMKKGDEVVIMYAKTAAWGVGFGVAPSIVLEKVKSIQQVKDFLETL